MKIAICDDDKKQIEIIQKSTEQYFTGVCDYQIDVFNNALIFLENLKKNGQYDIVLLDIYMPGILGVDVAKELRNRNDHTEIVFVTTSDEFAVDAFALNAAHYIIKPFTNAKFNEAMDRASARMIDRSKKVLSIKTVGGEVVNLDISEIIYIQSYGHDQIVTLKNNERYCETRRSLARLLEELETLSPDQFISPYKGYVVNQNCITTIGSKFIEMWNGDKIPLPRGTFRQIQKQYVAYRFKEVDKKSEVAV